MSLGELIATELRQAVPHGAHVLVEALRAKYGDAVRAVLFYGSCLRTQDDQHSLLDFYLFVDSYRDYTSPAWAALNSLLPPNVFYLETREGEITYRLKYAVVSLDDLDRLTAASTWQPYFWARFAQPCALVFAADAASEQRVVAACARSVKTFITTILPLLPESFSVRELWEIGLAHTYRTELRSEPAGAAPQLYNFAPQRFETVTLAAFAEVPVAHRVDSAAPSAQITLLSSGAAAAPPLRRDRRAIERARSRWRLRVIEGKTLFLLRILKNWCTFDGGVEYVMWKIERHSGVKPDPGWKQKRFRVLAVAAEAWKAYRRGGFR